MAKTTLTVATILATLFGNSHKALSEKLSTEEFNAFSAEAQELQDRLDAQEAGNLAVTGDLTKANADLAIAQAALTTAQTELGTTKTALTTANSTIATLTPKATAWDAHKAALNGSNLSGDSTNGKGGQSDTGSKENARTEKMRELKAKHPLLMADVDVPDAE
ncbi:hypothetical protein GO730_00595 [Spirosoma sp. HMF3257]|uniref:Uncharacterized protein n=1 Tax=Spirosoma telluris TaxID=2183553 RepID=A0A327NL49_9BACT|nr:hypothetical protein [Spirosoma telluris]RAI73298.1 hypothetical protein HMF3257_00580 [Spirosoma telluris]